MRAPYVGQPITIIVSERVTPMRPQLIAADAVRNCSFRKSRLHAIQGDDVRRGCNRAPCPPPFVIMPLHLTRSLFAPLSG
jgi:hypothetical protein